MYFAVSKRESVLNVFESCRYNAVYVEVRAKVAENVIQARSWLRTDALPGNGERGLKRGLLAIGGGAGAMRSPATGSED